MRQLAISLLLLALSTVLHAQPASNSRFFVPNFSNFSSASEDPALSQPEPFGAGGAGGEVPFSAERGGRFTRLTLRTGISMLGTGAEVATNLSTRLDLRAIGHYTNFTYTFPQSGFNIGLNIGFANAGSYVDYYPFHKAFRISAGYLYYNTNRVRANLQAGPGATFTINNVDYYSDNADPVNGVGRLILGGTGPLLTTGYGHILSRTNKHFSFPFEAGAAFINTPQVSFYLNGDVCAPQGNHCQNVNTYPGFAANLAAQLASWNKRVEPFHIYPLIQGGIAYTFRIRK